MECHVDVLCPGTKPLCAGDKEKRKCIRPSCKEKEHLTAGYELFAGEDAETGMSEQIWTKHTCPKGTDEKCPEIAKERFAMADQDQDSLMVLAELAWLVHELELPMDHKMEHLIQPLMKQPPFPPSTMKCFVNLTHLERDAVRLIGSDLQSWHGWDPREAIKAWHECDPAMDKRNKCPWPKDVPTPTASCMERRFYLLQKEKRGPGGKRPRWQELSVLERDAYKQLGYKESDDGDSDMWNMGRTSLLFTLPYTMLNTAQKRFAYVLEYQPDVWQRCYDPTGEIESSYKLPGTNCLERLAWVENATTGVGMGGNVERWDRFSE